MCGGELFSALFKPVASEKMTLEFSPFVATAGLPNNASRGAFPACVVKNLGACDGGVPSSLSCLPVRRVEFVNKSDFVPDGGGPSGVVEGIGSRLRRSGVDGG